MNRYYPKVVEKFDCQSTKHIHYDSIDNNDVVILNLELNYKLGQKELLLDKEAFSAITVLLYLISKRKHCKYIVLGKADSIDVLKNPLHYFLSAKGIYYVKSDELGGYFSDKYSLRILKELDITDLKRRLKTRFVLPKEIKHSWANIYGIYALDKVIRTLKIPKYGPPIKHTEIKKLKHDPDFLVWQILYNQQDDFTLSETDNETSRHYILHLRKKIQAYLSKDKRDKILFIDDKADHGWFQILNAIFPNTIIKIIPEKKNKSNFKELKNKIKNALTDPKYRIKCILLDLRLFDESSLDIKSKNTSGFQVLKYLNQHDPIIPKIAFTATNKARALQNLINEGSKGIFVKEGIEEKLNSQERIEALISFMEVVLKSLSEFDHHKENLFAKSEYYLNHCKNQINKSVKLENVFNNLGQFIKDKGWEYDYIFMDTNVFLKTEYIYNGKKHKTSKFMLAGYYMFLLTYYKNKLGNNVIIPAIYREISRRPGDLGINNLKSFDIGISLYAYKFLKLLLSFKKQKIISAGKLSDSFFKKTKIQKFYADPLFKFYAEDFIKRSNKAELKFLIISEEKSVRTKQFTTYLSKKYQDHTFEAKTLHPFFQFMHKLYEKSLVELNK